MAYESQDKMVSHPDHYQSKNGMETIDVIEAFTEGLNGIEAACTANILKYACRWKNKNGIQDLEKIIWYTQHLIDHLKTKKEAGTNVEQTLNTFDELGNTGGVHLSLKPNESYSFSFIMPVDKNPFVTDLREIPEVKSDELSPAQQVAQVLEEAAESPSDRKLLSDAERAWLIVAKHDGKKYIARDKDDSLCVYSSEPYKNKCNEWTEDGLDYQELYYSAEDLFQFINWEDEKAWLIDDLLKM